MRRRSFLKSLCAVPLVPLAFVRGNAKKQPPVVANTMDEVQTWSVTEHHFDIPLDLDEKIEAAEMVGDEFIVLCTNSVWKIEYTAGRWGAPFEVKRLI